MHRLPSSSPTRRWLIGLALSALLATQWLAAVHGIGHLRLRAPAGAARVPAATLVQGVLKFATGHDEDSPFCQWIDQLAHAAPMVSAAAALAAPVPVHDVALPRDAAVPASCAATYRARAPPFLA
jgi:hypothetical protein